MNEALLLASPREWRRRKLGDLAVLISRGTAPRYVERSDVLAIGQRCVRDVFVPADARPHDNRLTSGILQPERGDLLVNSTGTGTIGRVCIFPGGGKFIVDGHVTLLRVRESEAHPRWVHLVLTSPQGQRYLETWCYSGSTNQVELSRTALSEMVVPLPPVAEQRRIAEILGAADDAIRATQAVIAKLLAERNGIALRMLADPASYDGEMSTVDAEFAITAGIALGPHRRPRLNRRKYLRVANTLRDQLDLDDVLEMEATADEADPRELAPGDLLVVEGHANPDEIGRCARVDETAEGMLFQNHLFRLRTVGRVSSAFGVLWLNSNTVRRYWRRMCGTSSGLNTINRTMLAAVPIAVPSADVQTRVVDVIRAADGRIRAEGAYLAKLELQKQGLMQDLLTGRVQVNA